MTPDEKLRMQVGMAYDTFLDLVDRMRLRQDAFFTTKRTADLIRAKELEKDVDAVVARYRQGRLGMGP